MTENGVVIYGTSWCGDCRRVKKMLEKRLLEILAFLYRTLLPLALLAA